MTLAELIARTCNDIREPSTLIFLVLALDQEDILDLSESYQKLFSAMKLLLTLKIWIPSAVIHLDDRIEKF